MLDIESQMLDALDILYDCLEEPVEGLEEEVRSICLKEVDDLGQRTYQHMIMPDPALRDDLVIRHVLDREAFPLPIAIAAERYLELYEKAPLPAHARPIVDTIPTESDLPLTRVRNIDWDKFTYEASATGRFLTWTNMLINADLANVSVTERVFCQRMEPCYEQDTSSLQYKLYSRWNLADTIPDYNQEMGLSESVFLALHPNHPATDFLIHFQFMLTTWIEANSQRRSLSLKEAVLTYCTDLPEDVFTELMPPLSQIVIIDKKHQTLYHFGCDVNTVQRMMRFWQPEFA
ncbi:hypothetical protein [Bremerella sp. P1]|uniref:hypothetical protein n=1 Tax=Bremerella sp. P1 TaxID=3026424 RepID=UPI002367FC5B|nr:hypothetical protein [Bremerella sp. P1]WDI44499.1 hypothetical protein PSR63_11200 [Bremerella sp. P1]